MDLLNLTVVVMDNITEITANAYKNYFHALSKFGYKSYEDVSKLIVVSIIEDLLTNANYRYLITEVDYKAMERALNCLMGTTCLIPYYDFNSGDFPAIDNYAYNTIRIT